MGYMKSIIVAYDKHRGIGADNDLLWLRDLPDDLKHFKELTSGNTIVMGRRTYESIDKPLPNRRNIVVSSSSVDGVETVSSLEALSRVINKDKNVFVIGGGKLYASMIHEVDTIYATEVGETFPAATVFFPEIDMSVWHETEREHHDADKRNKYAFDFVTYTKQR